MTAYYSPNLNVGGTYGSVSSRPNPDLSWEETATANLGADFSMFKGRLTGSIDLYDKSGKHLLASTMGVPTEGFGYSTYEINNGEMTNKGIELSLSGDIIRTRDFTWNASLLYAYNKNKVSYVNVTAPVYYLQFDYAEAYPVVGNPYNAIYAYKWAGLSDKGLPQVYDANGNATTSNPSDLNAITYAGTTVPKYSGSFGSTLSYKGFDLSFLFIYAGGHKMRNTFLPFLGSAYNSAMGGYITSLTGAVNSDIANRWQKPGDEANTNIPRAIFAESKDYLSDSYDVYRYADINVIDASNLRLSNLSLAYHIPAFLCNKVYLKNARVQVNAENVFMLAKSRDAKYLLGGFNNPNIVFGLYLNF
jgi:hypothetical protein